MRSIDFIRRCGCAAFLLFCAVLHDSAPAAAAPLQLRIIAVNDLHGHLDPGEGTIAVPDPDDPQRTVALRSGGAAYLATRLRELRGEVEHSVFVSGGDLIGASPLVSALFRDEPTIEVMNLLGLTLSAAGNHEFDHGVAELQRQIRGGCATAPQGAAASCAGPAGRYDGARFPYLAANVVDGAGRTLLPAAQVVTIDGLRVGFIGAVTRATAGIVMPSGIKGWHFGDEAQAVNAEAARLRAAGVRAIVAVIHEGGEAEGGINDCRRPTGRIFEIASALDPAIDVVLSAHTHRAYRCLIDGRIVIQAASYGRLLAVVDLAIDRATGAVLRPLVSARNEPVPNGTDVDPSAALRRAYPPLAPDPAVEALVAGYRERAAPLAARPAGRIARSFDRQPSPGGDHAAGRLVADAQLAATVAAGAQIAFTNPGGIRGELRGAAADGTVSFGDLFTLQPFGNALVTLGITGAQLKQLLEAQWGRHRNQPRILQPSRGFSYAWRQDRPWGEHVEADSLRLDGVPIAPDRTYRITVNDFLAAGGDGFTLLRDAPDRVGGPLDVDALADHLRAQSEEKPLAPDPVARIRRLD